MIQRPGLREKKNAQVKEALYTAAMELFQEKGFDETSVEEISERAGLSRATFFNHFGSKSAVLRHHGLEMVDLVQHVIENADRSTDPVELIREVIGAMARYVEEHREEARLIYTYSLRDPDYLFEPTVARKRVWELLTRIVTEAQGQGQIRADMPAGEMALHILFLYQGAVLSIVSGLGKAESLIRSVWQFILGGIKGGDY